MHLMYVDESGDSGFPSSVRAFPTTGTPTRFFVRVGVIVHDWKWHVVNAKIDVFRASCAVPIPRQVEIHATEIRRGRTKVYDRTSRKRVDKTNWFGVNYPAFTDRMALLGDCCRLLHDLDVSLVCVGIDKTKVDRTKPNFRDLPKDNSWEFLIERYNLFLDLARDQRGLIISDAIEHKLEQSHREFARALIASSMHIREFHFVESILFEPSESSNLLQLADVCSYACHRKFNEGDESLFAVLEPKLLRRNGSPDGYGLKVWP